MWQILRVKSNGQTQPGRHVSTAILCIYSGLSLVNIFITDTQENATSSLLMFINGSGLPGKKGKINKSRQCTNV